MGVHRTSAPKDEPPLVPVWDATYVDTLAHSHFHGTSVRAGAEAAEKAKINKYRGSGTEYNFVPFPGPKSPSKKSLKAGLPSTGTLKKKASSQSVPSAQRRNRTIGSAASFIIRTVQSRENVSSDDKITEPQQKPSSFAVIRSKPSQKEDKVKTPPQNVKPESELDQKRREFSVFRKEFIQQQNAYIDQYAQLRDLEAQSGVPSGNAGTEVRLLSVTDWPVHDLLLMSENAPGHQQVHIKGVLGPKILQQLTVHLTSVREEVLVMGTELMRRRLEILKFIRAIQRNENRVFVYEGNNIEWQTKNKEFDEETVKLRELVLTTVKNLEVKLTHSLDAAKIPWIDRDNMIKKIERLQKELASYKKSKQETEKTSDHKKLLEDLQRERAARINLKEMLAAAEERSASARARCAELERQLSGIRSKWAQNAKQIIPRPTSARPCSTGQENGRMRCNVGMVLARVIPKQILSPAEEGATKAARCAGLERQPNGSRSMWEQETKQMHNNYRKPNLEDTSRKSETKKSEVTVEVLSRQRDTLQLRVAELQEQATDIMRDAEQRETQLMYRVESLMSKLEDQEKQKALLETQAQEMEKRLQNMQEQYNTLQETSTRLVEAQNLKRVEYLPGRVQCLFENCEILSELQATKDTLRRVRAELERSRVDKEDLVKSLADIAKDQPDKEMAAKLLTKERTITDMQRKFEELTENNNKMEQNLKCYEKQISALRLEISQLRNLNYYKSSDQEIPNDELEKQVYELCLRVERLTRERDALVSEAAKRALMLERHERCAELFAQVTRARRDLAAQLEGTSKLLDGAGNREVPPIHDFDISKSYLNNAHAWSALRAERARVLRLEGVVFAQTQQLERESAARIRQDRRRAQLERQLLRTWAGSADAGEQNTADAMKTESYLKR